jgi:hypothetical protein
VSDRPSHEADGFVTLNALELRALAALDPKRLLRWLEDSASAYLFGVERFESGGWGGRHRVTVNRNVELHFVPRFNDEMLDESELPRFTVMPDDARPGGVAVHPWQGGEEALPGEPDAGLRRRVIFYMSTENYLELVEELDELIESWSASPHPDDECATSFPFLPESLFPGLELSALLKQRVLPHEELARERRYDGRLGYPLGPQQDEELDEEIPPPIIDDDDELEEHEEWGEDPDDDELTDSAIERMQTHWEAEKRTREQAG